jgi:hypothetical protein
MSRWPHFFSKRRDRELDDEIQAHLAMATRDRIERGESPEAAELAARREFGNPTLTKEVTRQIWGWSSLETLGQDLSYGIRVLAKARGFTLATVLTLAVGIGASTLMFSAVNAILLRPLPFKDADRLAAIEGNFAVLRLKNIGALPREFIDYRDRADVFDSVTAFSSAYFNLVGSGEPERISGSAVSDQFFKFSA